MAFFVGTEIHDEVSVTINTAQIVYVSEGPHGGTNIYLTPQSGPGAALLLTISEDYQRISQFLIKVGNAELVRSME